MLNNLRNVVTGVVVVVSLSGCLLDRVREVQQQSCDFEKNFSISYDTGLTLTFNNPVLRYDDVRFIVGIAPSPEINGTDHISAIYTLSLMSEPTLEAIPVNLKFRKQADAFLLTELSIKSPLLNQVDPAHALQLAQDTCMTKLPLWQTRIEMPIPEIDQSEIPGYQQVIDLVGQPTRYGIDDKELIYRFVLTGVDNSQLSGSAILRYDDSGQRLLQTQSEFSYYTSGVDFERGTAWAGITL